MAVREARSVRGGSGDRLARCFGLEKNVRSIVARSLDHGSLTVTELVCDHENNGMSAPLPAEDSFLLTVQLRNCPHHDLWLDGAPQPTGPLSRGTVSIYDLRRMPVVNSTSPFHNLHFHMPRAALNAIVHADDGDMVDDLANDPGRGARDPIIEGLGLSLEGAFARPGEVTRLFVDHVTVAATLHIAHAYGRRQCAPIPVIPLSQAQERIAKEMLSERLTGDISLGELAAACRMAVGAFARGFCRTTGMPPHQWLLHRRLDRATELLRTTRLAPVAIASRSGFADLRHMRRVFVSLAGIRPETIRSI